MVGGARAIPSLAPLGGRPPLSLWQYSQTVLRYRTTRLRLVASSSRSLLCTVNRYRAVYLILCRHARHVAIRNIFDAIKCLRSVPSYVLTDSHPTATAKFNYARAVAVTREFHCTCDRFLPLPDTATFIMPTRSLERSSYNHIVQSSGEKCAARRSSIRVWARIRKHLGKRSFVGLEASMENPQSAPHCTGCCPLLLETCCCISGIQHPWNIQILSKSRTPIKRTDNKERL